MFGEVAARQKAFQSLFVAPGIGSTHRQFEKQLGRLTKIFEEEGKIDCVIIGSSTVLEGFNPAQFRQAIEASTGKDLSCFNFGVDGLAASGAGVLAQVLVKKFQPQLLIFGADPRDFIYPIDAWENTSILDSPWIQYQLGQKNIPGWLFEHSYLLKYQEPLRLALQLQKNELNRFVPHQEAIQWGYLPVFQARVDVSKPPHQNLDTHYAQVYFEILADYQMLPENLLGLEQILAQQKNGVQVLLVEMPNAPGYTDFFGSGSKDYETYLSRIREAAAAENVPFLHPQSEITIPMDGWIDYNHLNQEGTELFSEWLGRQVGQMILSGND